ncbi:MAG: cell division protein FtsX [Nitrospiria bacterium]
MMLFGLFLLFYYNVQGVVQVMRESVQFSIYLEEKSDGKIVQSIQDLLKADSRIFSFKYISKKDALDLFNSSFQDQALVDSLGSNPFPASFEVNVKPNQQNTDALLQIVNQYKKLSGVEEVQYGSEWLQNLNAFLTLLKMVGFGIGSFIGVAVMTNIANTIRLHFYNRREEIDIMKLIGATHHFIKIPFFLEGILMGTISGGFSNVFLFVVFNYSKGYLQPVMGTLGGQQSLAFLPMNILLGVVIIGSILGGLGSFISLNHLLRLRNPGNENERKKRS